jgi:hypothetical protein
VIFDGLRHLLFVLPMLALIAAWALLRLAPTLLRLPIFAFAAAGFYLVPTVATMIYLHPLEYVAINRFAGGIPVAQGYFDLDYWSSAATEAAHRLERRLAVEGPGA